MSKFNFQKVKDNILQVKRELPVLMANDAQRYFLDAFKKQGFDGNTWDQVKRRIPETPEYKYPKTRELSRRTKPILINTGRLRREVSLLAGNARVRYEQYNFIVTLTLNDSVVPYGKYHNNGDGKLPKRQFIGQSKALSLILRRRIKSYFDKTWQ